jgi:N-acetylglucosaminyl-diphospho-decaprenol L-rhamnosyltransferase
LEVAVNTVQSPVARTIGAVEVSVICVNWNSVSYLRECLASIYEHTTALRFEIIVVDNASPDGGVDVLKMEFPEIALVKSVRNLGFAGACNLGFRHSSGEYILLLNPDTELVGPAINTLLTQMKGLPDAGIVGCKLLNTDLSVQTASVQKFPTLLNQLTNIESLRTRWPGCPLWDISPLFRNSESPVKVEVIPGACMLLRRDIFERAGLLTEDYFMYAEDIDLNYKVKRLGLSSYYVGAAQIVHHGGTSSSRQPASHWSILMKHRAMTKYYHMLGGPVYGQLYRLTMGLSALLHVALLTFGAPFRDRDIVRLKLAKWSTVLRWAVGIDQPKINV